MYLSKENLYHDKVPATFKVYKGNVTPLDCFCKKCKSTKYNSMCVGAKFATVYCYSNDS